jgi:hypothetical protein
VNYSADIKEIVAALVAAEKEMGEVHRGGRNQHDQYNYATIENILDATKEILLKHGILVIASTETVMDAVHNGKTPSNRVFLNMEVMLAHTSGQYIIVKSVGEGVDSRDKAVYKAITGARKYAQTGALNLATSDNDPDADGGDDHKDPKQQARETQANQQLGLGAAPSGDDEGSLDAESVRKRVMVLCGAKKIPPAKVVSWLKAKGFANMDEATEEVRDELLKALNRGDISC